MQLNDLLLQLLRLARDEAQVGQVGVAMLLGAVVTKLSCREAGGGGSEGGTLRGPPGHMKH